MGGGRGDGESEAEEGEEDGGKRGKQSQACSCSCRGTVQRGLPCAGLGARSWSTFPSHFTALASALHLPLVALFLPPKPICSRSRTAASLHRWERTLRWPIAPSFRRPPNSPLASILAICAFHLRTELQPCTCFFSPDTSRMQPRRRSAFLFSYPELAHLQEARHESSLLRLLCQNLSGAQSDLRLSPASCSAASPGNCAAFLL